MGRKNKKWRPDDFLRTGRGRGSPVPFPAGGGRSGSGSGKSSERDWCSSLGVGGSPSREEPITLAVFHDAAVGSERGKPLIEGRVAHTALRPELGEGQGRSRAAECRGDALIEREWRRL